MISSSFSPLFYPKIFNPVITKYPRCCQIQTQQNLDDQSDSILIPSKTSDQDCQNLQTLAFNNQMEQIQNSNGLSLCQQQISDSSKNKNNYLMKDDKRNIGRGGNCIGSNIGKTLKKIMSLSLKDRRLQQFQRMCIRYRLKSQKQNTIILQLLLYIFIKKQYISLEAFDQIFDSFVKNLHQSSTNCQKKGQLEQSRRTFHIKNKKMYAKFMEINLFVYNILKSSILENSQRRFSFDELQQVISDTYDRKLRQIHKAMNRIKSIIVNHDELKILFSYSEHSIQQMVDKAIDYAYRRNLQKKSKFIKSKAEQVFQVASSNFMLSFEEKIFVGFLAIDLISEKKAEVSEQFLKNVIMKHQFSGPEYEGFKKLVKLMPSIFETVKQLNEQKYQKQTQKQNFEQMVNDALMPRYSEIYNKIKNSLKY